MRIGIAGMLLAWVATLVFYDMRQRRLPNSLTLPGAVAILLAAGVAGRGVPAAAGAAALAGLYLVVHLAAPAGMGAGDVKLALGLGALTGCFGLPAWFLAALGAPLLTAICGVVASLRGVRTVPHGPAMCVASIAAAGVALW